MPYERVLITTDFSEHAAQAARLAKRVAADGAELRVLHVVPLPGTHDFMSPTLRDQIDLSRQRYLATARTRLETWCKELGLQSASQVAKDGGVASVVAEEAKTLGADLVVAGARGHTRVVDILLGSKARAILRRVDCDVLIGRGIAPSHDEPKHILLATDFYEPAKAAGRKAVAIAQRWGVDILALHVFDGDEWTSVDEWKAREERATVDRTLTEMLHEFNVSVGNGSMGERVVHGKPAPMIATVAAEIHADLVVVGTHGSGAIARFLLGSVAEGVVEQSPCSVLLVKA